MNQGAGLVNIYGEPLRQSLGYSGGGAGLGGQMMHWTPPDSDFQLRVVCRQWASRVELLTVVFSATFEQVVS